MLLRLSASSLVSCLAALAHLASAAPSLSSLVPRSAAAVSPIQDPAQYVDPFIGTLNGGHVFAGASLPFGSVKAVADTTGGDNQGGFVSDNSPISGFSSTHDDGTGGSPSLGNFKLLPLMCTYPSECPRIIRLRKQDQVNNSARASPGQFSLQLASGIDAAVTVTRHVALYRFDYSKALAKEGSSGGRKGAPPASAAQVQFSNANKPPPRRGTNDGPTLLLDLTQDLPQTWQDKGGLTIQLADDVSKTSTISGSGTFQPSFGTGTYQLHFCASLPGVERAGTYADSAPAVDGQHTLVDPKENSGALLSLSRDYLQSNNGTLPVRMAISWTSVEAACAFGKDEVPDETYTLASTFDSIASTARQAWNSILSEVQVDLTGVSKSTITNFYSSFYRTFLSPTNITGDNPLWTSSEPYWDSIYCLWDSARIVHSAWATFIPDVQAEFVRALIDIYHHEGFLPDCRMSTNKGFTQGGSNADMLLSDSFVKGLATSVYPDGKIDWAEALKGMRKNAEVSPPDWGVEGRGGIDARKRLGYIPKDADGNKPDGPTVVPGRTASRLLEHAYNDFSIALVAAGLEGQQPDGTFADYVKRSADWKNLWNANTSEGGFEGFIQPRFANGSWAFQDPRRCSPAYQFGTCYLSAGNDNGEFYEASAHQYSFFVPHDMRTLIDLMGGDERFLDRLDYIWEKNFADIGDEVGFLPSVQYNYAKNGYRRTVDRTLDIFARYFNTSINGIPGNDDSGAVAAYVLWNSLGLYPNAGTAVYLLGTPHFPAWSVTSRITGKTANFIAHNFDGLQSNKYIVSATFNGQPFTRTWLQHDELFLQGGTLEVTLGPQPSDTFGTADADLPPSLSTGGFQANAAKGY